MSNSKGRGATRKHLRPRRTHNLGGCTTCRRRHVKCDQTRPHCTVCRNAGVQCGGFPSQIRWASMSTGPPARKLAQSPESTPEAPNPPSADSPSMNGPLVLHGNPSTTTESTSDAPAAPSAVLPATHLTAMDDGMSFGANEPDIFSYPTTSSLSDLESLFDSPSGLSWNDLFDPTMNFSMPVIQDQTYDDPLGLLAHVASQPQCGNADPQCFSRMYTPNQFSDKHNMGTMASVLDAQPPPYAPIDINEIELLEDAKVLLKHFRDVLIPQFAPLPMNTKSPWEVLNWSAAVQTHADMTFLQSPYVKHANKANLFAILGCSACTITKTHHYPDTMSDQKAIQILDYVSRRAKAHMQESLRTETSGSQKAKYKNQLMAIFSLIALATLSGNSTEARCYLIDAERLLRVRGLAKREVSRRARLLHHVYTWLRIIGESTFTLHDQNSSGLQAKIENIIKNHCRDYNAMPASGHDAVATDEHSLLDDFLRVGVHGTDSDSDVDASKDHEAGLRDIHLADIRQWSNTLYMDIYGIPEVWLSLVSQTTRVANIIDLLERTSLQVPRSLTHSLQRKTNRLEHLICSFSAQHSVSGTSSPSRDGNHHSGTTTSKPSLASQSMLRAMSSGLVILFYRRIRKVHPFILQSHVNDVITALTDFDRAQGVGNNKTPGTPWPAFIAGCEAITTSSRDWLMTWLQRGASQSASTGFTSAQQVMREVWEQRDVANRVSDKNTGQVGSKKGEICSWVDVLRDGQFWLMLY